MTKLSWEPTLCVAWVGMYRHLTSCNQGAFLRKREDPGNEVGDIVICTVDKKVHNFKSYSGRLLIETFVQPKGQYHCFWVIIITLKNHSLTLLDANYSLPFQALQKCILGLRTKFCCLGENHDTQGHVCFQSAWAKKTSPRNLWGMGKRQIRSSSDLGSHADFTLPILLCKIFWSIKIGCKFEVHCHF